jgi:hypothetical protein
MFELDEHGSFKPPRIPNEVLEKRYSSNTTLIGNGI